MIKPNYNYSREYSTQILFSIFCYSVIYNHYDGYLIKGFHYSQLTIFTDLLFFLTPSIYWIYVLFSMNLYCIDKERNLFLFKNIFGKEYEIHFNEFEEYNLKLLNIGGKNYRTLSKKHIILTLLTNNNVFYKTTIRDTKNYEELIVNIRSLDLTEVV